MYVAEIIETVEWVSVWDLLKNQEWIREQTDDHVIQRELTRILESRAQLEYQRDYLRSLFPNRKQQYENQYQVQIRDLEETIKDLLPNLNYDH